MNEYSAMNYSAMNISELKKPQLIWPAIIHYHGQAELAFIADQLAWEKGQYLQAVRYHPSDALIDAEGCLYQILTNADGSVSLQRLNEKASLQEVIEMIRAHAAELGACCVAKFSATSIQDAINTMANSADG